MCSCILATNVAVGVACGAESEMCCLMDEVKASMLARMRQCVDEKLNYLNDRIKDAGHIKNKQRVKKELMDFFDVQLSDRLNKVQRTVIQNVATYVTTCMGSFKLDARKEFEDKVSALFDDADATSKANSQENSSFGTNANSGRKSDIQNEKKPLELTMDNKTQGLNFTRELRKDGQLLPAGVDESKITYEVVGNENTSKIIQVKYDGKPVIIMTTSNVAQPASAFKKDIKFIIDSIIVDINKNATPGKPMKPDIRAKFIKAVKRDGKPIYTE